MMKHKNPIYKFPSVILGKIIGMVHNRETTLSMLGFRQSANSPVSEECPEISDEKPSRVDSALPVAVKGSCLWEGSEVSMEFDVEAFNLSLTRSLRGEAKDTAA